MKQQGRSGRYATMALSAFVIVAPQLLGGATDATAFVIAVFACFVGLITAYATLHTARLGTIPSAGLAAAVALVWTLVQALPLPCSMVGWTQPAREEIARVLVELGAIAAPSCSLSAAPGATRASVAVAAALFTTLLSAVALARCGHRQTLLQALALSAVCMACVAFAHAILNEHAVFGMYVPRDAKPQLLLSPLMNENHLAGHMALGWPLCLAFAQASQRADARFGWIAASIAVCAAGLLSLSRGGAGALLAGGGSYLAITFWKKGKLMRAGRLPLALGSAVAAVGLIGAAAFDLIARQFVGTGSSLDKLALPLQLSRLIAERPWSGVGRGALVDVGAQAVLRNARLTHVENLPVQWLIDWGVPATLVIFTLILASLVRVRPQRSAEWALLCGFSGLVAQNLVDFSLELPALGCVAAASLGVLVSRERSVKREARFRLPALRTAMPAAAAVCVASVAVFSPWLTTLGRHALEEQLASLLPKRSAEFDGLLKSALISYPLDPAFIVFGATRAVSFDAGGAPRWLNLAMISAPGWAMPHLLAAHFLERHGHFDQAALELSIALGLSPSATVGYPCAFLKRHPEPDLAWALVPEGMPGEQQQREALASCLLTDNRWTALTPMLEQIVTRFPKSAYARARLVQAAGRDSELAIQRAEELWNLLPDSPESTATLAETLARHGQLERAQATIAGASSEVRHSEPVLTSEAMVAALSHDDAHLHQVVDALLSKYGNTSKKRASLLLFASHQFTAAGDHTTALAYAQQAYDLSGDLAMLEIAHQAAVRAGVIPAVLRTASELCQVGHRGNSYCGKAATVNNGAARSY